MVTFSHISIILVLFLWFTPNEDRQHFLPVGYSKRCAQRHVWAQFCTRHHHNVLWHQWDKECIWNEYIKKMLAMMFLTNLCMILACCNTFDWIASSPTMSILTATFALSPFGALKSSTTSYMLNFIAAYSSESHLTSIWIALCNLNNKIFVHKKCFTQTFV